MRWLLLLLAVPFGLLLGVLIYLGYEFWEMR